LPACGLVAVLALALAAPGVGALGLSKPPDLDNIHVTLGENYQFQVRVYGEDEPIEVEMVADNIDFVEFDPQQFSLGADESRQVTVTLTPENLGTYEGTISACKAGSAQGGNPVLGAVSADLRVTVEESSGEGEQPGPEGSAPSQEGEIPAAALGAAVAIVVGGLVSGLYLTRWR